MFPIKLLLILLLSAICLSNSSNIEDDLFQGDLLVQYNQIVQTFGESTAKHAAKEGIHFDTKNRKLGAPVDDSQRLWKGGLVYYDVDNSISEDKEVILDALDAITSVTGVKFIHEQHIDGYILFRDGKSCSSKVGFAGELQYINLKKTAAITCRTKGIITHEILHTLGMWHEQSVVGRDKYVKIIQNNINPSKRFNFDIQQNTVDLGIPYDYSSIMHYKSTSFSIQPKRLSTIVAINKDGSENIKNTKRMGQRKGISDLDALQVQLMYHCTINNPSTSTNRSLGGKTIETLCSPLCPCNIGQGNCRSDEDCKDGLRCKRNVGVYSYLLATPMEIAGLNICEQDTRNDTNIDNVENDTIWSTSLPTASPTELFDISPNASANNDTKSPPATPTENSSNRNDPVGNNITVQKDQSRITKINGELIISIAIVCFCCTVIVWYLYARHKNKSKEEISNVVDKIIPKDVVGDVV